MQNIIYSGTVPITRNPTSFVYTIGTNRGQQQFFGRLQRHVPDVLGQRSAGDFSELRDKVLMNTDRHFSERMHGSCILRLSLLLLVCSSAAGCAASYTIRFTAGEIQQALNRKLPISKSKFLVRATVQSVEVELREAPDRILLHPQVGLSIAGQSALAGQALVEGQIRYAPESGEFFFDSAKVVEMTIAGIPESARPVAEELIAKAGEAYLSSTPLYRLKQTDFKHSLARMLLKSVKVRDGQLQVVIGMP
jgi:hypothetical protein